MEKKLKELQEKYVDLFKITDSKGWINIKSVDPVYDNHPTIDGPAYLDYTIEKKDHRKVTLEDRSRNVWLRDGSRRGIQSVSYCGGLGIWQVSQGGVPIAGGDLGDREVKIVENWLKCMDEYIFERMPELKKFLEQQ